MQVAYCFLMPQWLTVLQVLPAALPITASRFAQDWGLWLFCSSLAYGLTSMHAQQDPDADEHGSTCLLIFHAGPPYEDTAFKILNKEWEYSHKKGFKSTFERGILHLYFNFKRNRYRR